MMQILQVEVQDDATDRLGEMIRMLERMGVEGPIDADLSALPPPGAQSEGHRRQLRLSARCRRSRTAWKATSPT